MFVDSHAHIDGAEYDADRDDVIARARDAGVSAILNVGTGDPHGNAFERAVELAEQHRDIYASVGVHPHDARLFDQEAEEKILRLIEQSRKIVAWGEIGLDYHYDNSPREVQREVFRRQLRLARAAQLPVIIHSREAGDDTINILGEEMAGYERAGVLHCFGGGMGMAESALALGFLISFAGVLTFKNAQALREIAARLPLDRVLIETDCPYLTPVPFRGKRNEPARVVEVARCLADLHAVELAEIGRITTANFGRLFQVEL
jgi:TatD DNase family protein